MMVIKIKEFFHDEQPVARSQARLLFDDAKEVVLDFEGVDFIGQGFADEAFRVYPNHHPGVMIRAINTNTDIDRMIRHVGVGG